jgi:hypothetical protein
MKGAVRRKALIILVLLSSGIVARTKSKPMSPPEGRVPPERTMLPAPPERPVSRVPRGNPPSHAPVPHVARVPAPHRVSPPPNPRLPRLVRDVHGGDLQDLFELFPDLPRPPRTHPTVVLRLRIRTLP